MQDVIQKINEYAKINAKNNKMNITGTHMPFIFYTKSNDKQLLFDIYTDNAWKLHLYSFKTGKITRVKTPTSTIYGVNECNPTIYIKDNNYVLSYIAAPTDDTIDYNNGHRQRNCWNWNKIKYI